MKSSAILTLTLGLILFSFITNGVLIVPFIDLLYRLKLTRRKEAPKRGKIPLFDKLHDIKAGTPVGGGILIISTVCLIFLTLVPLAKHMGISFQSSFNEVKEIFIILFTFISFGILGLFDDIVKILGKPRKGALGMWIGLPRKIKFALQWILGFFVGYYLYSELGIHILHIPIIDKVINLGIWYIPFAAFTVVAFSNATNITDGLDGLVSGLLIICLLSFGILAASILDTPLSLFISLWIGALIAFTYFNVWPARIILGDVGALSFGATLAIIGLLTGSIIALVVIGGLFVLDTASSFIQIVGWKLFKRGIFPLAPIHHTFLAIGWEEPKIVMRAWLAAIVLSIIGLWLATI